MSVHSGEVQVLQVLEPEAAATALTAAARVTEAVVTAEVVTMGHRGSSCTHVVFSTGTVPKCFC